MGTFTVIVCWFLLLVKFATAGQTYNVIDYKAVGDGITDDSQAFLNAWNAVCSDDSSPTLLIPSGKKFLIGTATSFKGPCKSAISIQLDGYITAPNRIWTTENVILISFYNINNLNVYGEGTIDGQGAIWWDCFKNNKCVRPYLLDFSGCDNLSLKSIKLTNGPRRHLSFHKCTHLKVTGLTITAPGDSPNTDAINIGDSSNIEITGSRFAIGDDCIALSSGTSNVKISQMTCGPSHGISIGSLGKGGARAEVENIHVSNCDISQSMTGVRIKTWKGGSGYVKDVTFENIKINQVQTPIVITQSYTDYSSFSEDDAVAISNVRFAAIQGTSTQANAIAIDCSATVPCTGLSFSNINLARDGDDKTITATVSNAYGTTQGTIIPAIPLSQKS